MFRECNKFASVFTLCALSIDRFLAAFHNLGRYRQIRVGILICAAIWTVCFASSTPYWMFASVTPSRPGRGPSAPGYRGSMISNHTGTRFRTVAENATDGRVFDRGDNCGGDDDVFEQWTATAKLLEPFPSDVATAEFRARHADGDRQKPRFGNTGGCGAATASADGTAVWDTSDSGELIGRETTIATVTSVNNSRRRTNGGGSTKLSCRMYWPPGYRKSWTYVQLVLGVFVPLVAIAIFNGLLLHRLHVLNAVRVRSKAGSLPNETSTAKLSTAALSTAGTQLVIVEQRRGTEGATVAAQGSASRVRRLTSVSRMMLVVVTVFAVCQLPYHVMEIISLVVEDSKRLPSPEFSKVFIYCNMIAQIMAFLSSCINPIVYGVFNKNYRECSRLKT